MPPVHARIPAQGEELDRRVKDNKEQPHSWNLLLDCLLLFDWGSLVVICTPGACHTVLDCALLSLTRTGFSVGSEAVGVDPRA